MENSIFINKEAIPNNNDLKDSLGETYDIWQTIVDHVHLKYPNSIDEWNNSKNGWSFRMKDKKRAIIYFLPRDKYFKVALVYGQKATDTIMKSQISDSIKSELNCAKVYAEGRGIRIDIKDNAIIDHVKELIDIKLAN
jgi:hypothetical protein